MNLKDTCERADVRAADLGRLLGVTRISVHNWLHGKSNPNKYLAAKVGKIERALQAAVAAGDLPLQNRPTDPVARTRAIGLIIVKHHRQQEAA